MVAVLRIYGKTLDMQVMQDHASVPYRISEAPTQCAYFDIPDSDGALDMQVKATLDFVVRYENQLMQKLHRNGAEGAMVAHRGEIVTVPAFPVSEVVDVTGAGDLFASGFLLAYARERDLSTALSAGCLAASEVISHIGARPVRDLAEMAREHGVGI